MAERLPILAIGEGRLAPSQSSRRERFSAREGSPRIFTFAEPVQLKKVLSQCFGCHLFAAEVVVSVPKKRLHCAGPSMGAFAVAPSGRVAYLSNAASRAFDHYFGRRADTRRLPAAMNGWWETRPEQPSSWEKRGADSSSIRSTAAAKDRAAFSLKKARLRMGASPCLRGSAAPGPAGQEQCRDRGRDAHEPLRDREAAGEELTHPAGAIKSAV